MNLEKEKTEEKINIILNNEKLNIHPPNNNEKPIKNRRKISKFIFVNAIASYYPLVKECLESFGFKLTDSETKNMLFWVNHKGSIEFASTLLPWQFYNHFPGMRSLANKTELCKNLDPLIKALPNVYNFYPKAFIIPGQYSELKIFMNSIPKKSKRTFIIKPDKGSLGKGIILIQDPNDIEDSFDLAIAQQYISPFLIDNLKFDLRIYALVTSIEPLRIYIHHEGMARFCTEPYESPRPSNLEQSFSHLTNYSLNKKNEHFQNNSISINDNSETGHKRSLTSIYEELSKKGFNPKKVQEDIDELIRLTIASVQPYVASQYRIGLNSNDNKSRCFEILGFDIILDENAKPWLLEVNCKPSMAAESEFDKQIKTSVLTGTFTILQLNTNFKKQVLERQKALSQKRISGNTNLSLNSLYDPNSEIEISKTTNWRLIFPISDDVKSSIKEALLITKKLPYVGGVSSNNATRIRKEAVDAQFKQKEVPQKRKIKSPKPIYKKLTPIIPNSNIKPVLNQNIILPQKTPLINKQLPSISYNQIKPLIKNNYNEEQPFFLQFRNLPQIKINEIEERERLKFLKNQIILSQTLMLPNKIKLIIYSLTNFVTQKDEYLNKNKQKSNPSLLKPLIIFKQKIYQDLPVL